ncbi:MAG: ANTAR domain-containing protein [Ilumatobacteraceae bacterium]
MGGHVGSHRAENQSAQSGAPLCTALDSRVVIEQAKGIIAVQRGLPTRDAFETLRAEARRRRVAIHLVAAEVVRDHDGSASVGR